MKTVKKLVYLMTALILLIIVTILEILSEILCGLDNILKWIVARLKGVNETLMSKAGITEYEYINEGFEIKKGES